MEIESWWCLSCESIFCPASDASSEPGPCSTCGEQRWQRIDTRAGAYYVSAFDGLACQGFAAGPFATHIEALKMVFSCKNEGGERDPRAVFWAWGTARVEMDADSPPVGVLNDHFGLVADGAGMVVAR